MQNLFFKQGLKELAKENMTREQITAFCVEQTGHNGEGEIGLLCNEKLIDWYLSHIGIMVCLFRSLMTFSESPTVERTA